MRRAYRLLTVLAGVCLMPAGLAAQYPEQGDMGGAGRVGGWRQRAPSRSLPTEEQIDGPALPEFFAPRFQLDSAQAGRYRAVYDSFMNATAAIRDSARSARRLVVGAFQNGDRETARAGLPVVTQLGDSLAKLETYFDQGLRGFLSSRQIKAYRKWQGEQRRQQAARQREAMPELGDRPRN